MLSPPAVQGRPGLVSAARSAPKGIRAQQRLLSPHPRLASRAGTSCCSMWSADDATRSVACGMAPSSAQAISCSDLDAKRVTPFACIEEEGGVVTIHDDLNSLLTCVPENVRQKLEHHPRRGDLLEIILDLGRAPEARFLGGEGGESLRDEDITQEELEFAEAALGSFGGDNRAGIEGTLHRISCMRNRRGKIVGLTCRVGRAVTGHVDMIRDMLEGNDSILFLGKPGIGKSTVIREIARVLADELHKRVVIIDTSNEIGGDGDVPHPAIGLARRMQVPDPSVQDKIMIEAVENHMPQVIIIDEISTVEEALACRTIAERGVQLVATAHGSLLENLIKNPTLSDLVGGVQSVTLGDDEARVRGTQKTILERKAPATFPTLVEMRARTHWVAHNVEESVDALLTGRTPLVEVRTRDAEHKAQRSTRPYDFGGEGAAPGAGAGLLRGGGWAEAGREGGIGGAGVQVNWAMRLGDVPDKDDPLEVMMLKGGSKGGAGRGGKQQLVRSPPAPQRGGGRR